MHWNNLRITENITRHLIFLFCIFFLLPADSFAEVAIEITGIGASKTSEMEIWIPEKEDIFGKIKFDKSQDEDLLLQLAWRRAGDDTWWIHKQSIPFSPTQGKEHFWEFRGVLLGSNFDYKRTLEIVAFAVAKDAPLPEGIIDYNSLLYLSQGISNQVSVLRKARDRDRFLVTPRIRIASIDTREVRHGAVHEVGLKAVLKGEVRRPTDSKVRLVAQPLGMDQYWVMEDEPLIRSGKWTARMNFVANGLEAEQEFVIFAVILQEDIPRGRPIFRPEWEAFLQSKIIGISTVIRATRIEIPLGKNQIGIKILAVDDMPLNFSQDWEVRPRSNIKGILLGRPLNFDEAVFVLAATEFKKESWRLLGKASMKNGRYWELSPQLLGESGDYIKLIAVVAENSVTLLNKKNIEENIAFSRTVQIRTQDAPPIIIKIKRVDKLAVGGKVAVDVNHISSVEGSISGRPLDVDDNVWVLKTPDDDGQTWKLLGRAGFSSKRHWSLPPISLGDSGDELILVAVVSKSKIEAMTVQERGNVLASSDKIRVTLTD